MGALALDYEGEDLRATLDFIGQREDLDAPQRPFFPMAGIEIPDAPDGRSNVQEPWEWSKSKDLSWLGRLEYDLSDTVTVFGAVGGAIRASSVFSARQPFLTPPATSALRRRISFSMSTGSRPRQA
ncbi:hypothetical protein AJ87_37955 [Rhizobium yanglingense]|nr:hypothetical protein AJ87_37955 [Rhizobium yanglingense]